MYTLFKEAVMLNTVGKVLMDSVHETKDIIPLHTMGLLTREEAQALMRKLFDITRDYETLQGFLNRKIMSPTDTWVRNAVLHWMGRSPEALFAAVEWNVFGVEEIKPLIFLHLIRQFNEERSCNNHFKAASELLYKLRAKGYVTQEEEDSLLVSVYLLRSDLSTVFVESHTRA